MLSENIITLKDSARRKIPNMVKYEIIPGAMPLGPLAIKIGVSLTRGLLGAKV